METRYWVLTDPSSDTPEKALALLRLSGGVIERWVPHRETWVDNPTAATDLFGDDVGAIEVGGGAVESYQAARVGEISEENLAVLTRKTN